jgi:4'-phosphopantetheinyl transferase
LGCDLEVIEPHSSAFITDYFTAEEQALIAKQPPSDRPLFPALLWSAKESVLKALRTGLRLDTRRVAIDPFEISRDIDAWQPFLARHAGDKVFHGWWQASGRVIRTIAAAPPPAPPIRLQVPASEFVRPPCNDAPAWPVESR